MTKSLAHPWRITEICQRSADLDLGGDCFAFLVWVLSAVVGELGKTGKEYFEKLEEAVSITFQGCLFKF